MRRFLVAAVFLLALPLVRADAPWHGSLYLGNGDAWRQRVRVDVRNDSDRQEMGTPVTLRIGGGVGEAGLVGARAESVRVCDASGAEMLYDITARDGRPIIRGPVPAGSSLTLPVECPDRGACAYYVYFDNPSAWAVPDFLGASASVRNGGLEEGKGDAPAFWQHDTPDAEHRAFWVTEDPHSGKRCLRTVVAEGADATWIATRQGRIHIISGARYVMRAWVKAEGVKGDAGWYIHVGNGQAPMMISPMLLAGPGTFGWQEVRAEFAAPESADVADLGTVLHGTGTAWFDDISLETDATSGLSAVPAKPERRELGLEGADAPWFDDNPADGIQWSARAPITIRNTSDLPQSGQLVCVNVAPLLARFRGRANESSLRVTDAGRAIPFYRAGDALLFETKVPPGAARTYYAYVSDDARIKPLNSLGYAALLEDPRNLVKNPSFELGGDLPSDWPADAEGDRPAGTTMAPDKPGIFGERCVKVSVPAGTTPGWVGWRQSVPVEPECSYLLAGWVRCAEIARGEAALHAHYRNAAGELCESRQMTSASPAISGNQDWTLMSGVYDMPEDAASFQLHLTMNVTGTVWHDGLLLVKVSPATAGTPQPRAPSRSEGLAVWPVNAIVKVFRHDTPPDRVGPLRISVARNEQEPLQLAVLSPDAVQGVTVAVDLPVSAAGERLSDVRVGVVGYVPIDYPTNYYLSNTPSWHRRHPTSAPSCDGWAGWWPDPLLPRNAFDLAPGETQPVWLTVSVPNDATPGDYAGMVRFVAGGRTLRELPFTVHVWDFALPDEPHVGAIYDVRVGGQWQLPGKTDEEARRQMEAFMAEHRVCPDVISPDPVIKYANGVVTADFSEFDRAAEYYFTELKLPYTYTPWYFYGFGWGNPIEVKFGESPYDGEYPFPGVDRGKLRPEYKRAYQAVLRAYWDHMKEKGWADKVALYLSDEPYYHMPEIRAQMKALCEMIHEVDPAIPIYVSTWQHCPEWDGYINLWGIGHYGIVSPKKIPELRAAGDRLRFTTDGQMCTDTPYCAVERLLPHYCFKYGVEAYEFWGISWLTYNPYEFGWHSYISQSGQPGETTWVRYPNGDGFLAYPGGPIGHDGPVSSIRLEQAREGCEDFEYLYLLRDRMASAKAAGRDTSTAERALSRADRLVTIPNAGGRFSTRILPDPDEVFRVKQSVARAIEELGNGRRGE